MIYCSFCGKSQQEVAKLIAGPSAFICDECVLLMVDIMFEEARSNLKRTKTAEDETAGAAA